MPSVNMDNFEFPISAGPVVKGILFALSIALLLSLCAGLIYHLSPLSEKTLPLLAAIILASGAFGGSLTAGRQAGNKGLYHGLAVGLLFFIVVWAAAALFVPGQAGLNIFYKLLIILGSGTIGGVFGVGLS
ncbi:TIGR04086 family membrane protein [Pelotomaculum terephthalicicum JT]|uniref:TIGR04086 family membrane protein n=1 Tax=Pelotomaculum TaxID=191373 RepID=UPI0009D2E527|nr:MULTISPECIES: TIGR04086 family membrane protein [Pelotomaculum]MCG9967634.1 TIGR04086 family membrane protein [Pelotomaculum terephthalicicum JT]OPX84068.1 MAG: hypothetical protein A4E54_03034 [Pelotomaculum sp. PtaB.Bin117]OPY60850.1 MAG: hypothetical protein A4E56_02428 [Pelotomaculum sp. PtaU1.Bin065]